MTISRNLVVLFALLLLTFAVSIFQSLLNAVAPSSGGSEELPTYSVTELVNAYQHDPLLLHNKSINLKAYVAEVFPGKDCASYAVLIDYENLASYKKSSGQIPSIKTGRLPEQSSPLALSPAQYAIYNGRFYDKWYTKNCTNGKLRFVVSDQVQALAP